jgi:hypothetical protein
MVIKDDCGYGTRCPFTNTGSFCTRYSARLIDTKCYIKVVTRHMKLDCFDKIYNLKEIFKVNWNR